MGETREKLDVCVELIDAAFANECAATVLMQAADELPGRLSDDVIQVVILLQEKSDRLKELATRLQGLQL